MLWHTQKYLTSREKGVDNTLWVCVVESIMMKERSVQCRDGRHLVVTVALSIPGRGPEESWIRGVHSQEQHSFIHEVSEAIRDATAVLL